MTNTTAKLDSELLEKVKKLIKKNPYKYANLKQFINISVLHLLEEESKKEGENGIKNKK